MEISWWPPPLRDGADFNFKKLKSLGETFSLSYWRDVHKAGAVRMVKKKGAGGGGGKFYKKKIKKKKFF